MSFPIYPKKQYKGPAHCKCSMYYSYFTSLESFGRQPEGNERWLIPSASKMQRKYN